MSTFQNTIPVRHRLGTRGRAMLAAIALVAITTALIIALAATGRTANPTSSVQRATPLSAPATQSPSVTKPHPYLDPETGQMHGA